MQHVFVALQGHNEAWARGEQFRGAESLQGGREVPTMSQLKRVQPGCVRTPSVWD